MPSTLLPRLFEDLPPEFEPHFEPATPWELLGESLDSVLAALPSEAVEINLDPGVHLAGDRIVIGKGTRIHPGATLEGPVRIGLNCIIRPGAFLRGGNWVGDGCVVGANTEIKHSILLDGAKAPHLNYVGDSILGRRVNLGAGTILSNFRHDASPIHIPTESQPLSTGRRKLGALLGDGALTGCNCVLHPGVIVGAGTQIYPGLHLRSGLYPARALLKLRQVIESVELS